GRLGFLRGRGGIGHPCSSPVTVCCFHLQSSALLIRSRMILSGRSDKWGRRGRRRNQRICRLETKQESCSRRDQKSVASSLHARTRAAIRQSGGVRILPSRHATRLCVACQVAE